MKYKVGDKVEIKTWIELQKEFGVSRAGDISRIPCFLYSTNELLDMESPTREVEITKIVEEGKEGKYSYYETKECGNWAIGEYAIKGYEPTNIKEEIEEIEYIDDNIFKIVNGFNLTTKEIKYKVGDVVKIKTLKEIEKIEPAKGFVNPKFIKYMEEEFGKIYPNRIVEIVEIYQKFMASFYKIKGNLYWNWDENMIEGLVSEIEKEKINSRFEILDIRED